MLKGCETHKSLKLLTTEILFLASVNAPMNLAMLLAQTLHPGLELQEGDSHPGKRKENIEFKISFSGRNKYPLGNYCNISHLGKRKIIFKSAIGRGYVSSLEGISLFIQCLDNASVWSVVSRRIGSRSLSPLQNALICNKDRSWKLCHEVAETTQGV